MAFVVSRPNGSWEARETVTTERGPRSRTLATFRVLDAAAIERALSRASLALSAEELVEAAQRVGAPVEPAAPDAAARALLAELARGRAPRPGLRRILASALADGPRGEPVPAAAGWAASSVAERGEALADLLALADAVPARRRGSLRFPPLVRAAP